jgi:hypothetical protein
MRTAPTDSINSGCLKVGCLRPAIIKLAWVVSGHFLHKKYLSLLMSLKLHAVSKDTGKDSIRTSGLFTVDASDAPIHQNLIFSSVIVRPIGVLHLQGTLHAREEGGMESIAAYAKMFYGPEASMAANNEARFYRKKLRHLAGKVIPKFYGVYHYEVVEENDEGPFSMILLENCDNEGFNRWEQIVDRGIGFVYVYYFSLLLFVCSLVRLKLQ